MIGDLDKILDDCISKSDYEPLFVETEKIIKDYPDLIITLINLINFKDIKPEWQRYQVTEYLLLFLWTLEEDVQIRISYEIAKRPSMRIDIKALADKLGYLVSADKLLDQIIKTIENSRLKEYNQLLVYDLLLRGKSFTENEKEVIINSLSDFDFNWAGLELDDIEKGLPLKTHLERSVSFNRLFGLQSEEKTLYSFVDFGSLVLRKNTNQVLNDLSSTIAKKHIRLIEIGDFEYTEEKTDDLEAKIICLLDYNKHLSKSTKIVFKRISGKIAFSYLFNMAIVGGAYDYNGFGATSRINAWKTISGLIQVNYFESNKQEVINELNQFTWTEFSCDNDWFINEWIDLGIIGINRQKKKYAILAITDTD